MWSGGTSLCWSKVRLPKITALLGQLDRLFTKKITIYSHSVSVTYSRFSHSHILAFFILKCSSLLSSLLMLLLPLQLWALMFPKELTLAISNVSWIMVTTLLLCACTNHMELLIRMVLLPSMMHGTRAWPMLTDIFSLATPVATPLVKYGAFFLLKMCSYLMSPSPFILCRWMPLLTIFLPTMFACWRRVNFANRPTPPLVRPSACFGWMLRELRYDLNFVKGDKCDQ